MRIILTTLFVLASLAGGTLWAEGEWMFMVLALSSAFLIGLHLYL